MYHVVPLASAGIRNLPLSATYTLATTMKVGESVASQRPEVRLPIEILAHIVSYIPAGAAGQSTAWACCLVSHQWYSAAVSRLYEKPRLTGPNFENFSAVICPPVNAHVRSIGIEHHVKHLDMSGVAYESKNSQTARLLGRVGKNLEVFIAPATSFSWVFRTVTFYLQRV